MRIALIILAAFLLSSCMPRAEYEAQKQNGAKPAFIIDNPDDEMITLLRGAMSDNVLYATLIGENGYEKGSSFYLFGAGKTIAELTLPTSNRFFDPFLIKDRRAASFEWEANVVKHFGKQNDFELNFIIFSRWHITPFDNFADINIAFGDGLSYASEIPYYERIRWPKRSQLLNNMSFELAFDMPVEADSGVAELSAVVRLHHRSGAFGLFNGVHGASNVVAVGLRSRYY